MPQFTPQDLIRGAMFIVAGITVAVVTLLLPISSNRENGLIILALFGVSGGLCGVGFGLPFRQPIFGAIFGAVGGLIFFMSVLTRC